MIRYTLPIITLLTITFVGCEPTSTSPSPRVGPPPGGSALRVIDPTTLPAGISKGWRYATSSGKPGWLLEIPVRSKSAHFPVRIAVESGKIVSLQVPRYNSTHGRSAARPAYTDLFADRRKSALPVDAISGATSTSNAINRAAAKALAAADTLER
ncbi:MAG: FMN-binding protein [Phycisphaerales bacterium]|jgi:hypothetical protein|nr:FMN-binding protein [Phycisphaerales bacterium]MBT7171795.1 FMN-binding protein [Phycisphaerales bacterium]